jgi:putative FmdB family regulatory protein
VPTYAYACTECGHTFEAVQSFSDDALTVCPECEGRLRKVFSNVGVVFKGSGFYRTDSRADSRGDSAKGNGDKPATKATESSGGEKKSDGAAKGGDSGGSTSSGSSGSTTASSTSGSAAKTGSGSGSAA